MLEVFFYDMMHVDMMHIGVNKKYMMQVVDLVGVNMIWHDFAFDTS